MNSRLLKLKYRNSKYSLLCARIRLPYYSSLQNINEIYAYVLEVKSHKWVSMAIAYNMLGINGIAYNSSATRWQMMAEIW